MDILGTYILDGHQPKQAELLEWARWYATANRIVKSDMIDGVHVSTVFLGTDHSFGQGKPLLFETMIFGGEHDGYQERYATWVGAEAGHEKAVKLVSK